MARRRTKGRNVEGIGRQRLDQPFGALEGGLDAEFPGAFLCALQVGVGDGDDARLGDLRPGCQVMAGNHAGADQPDSQRRVAVRAGRCSRGCHGKVTRLASSPVVKKRRRLAKIDSIFWDWRSCSSLCLCSVRSTNIAK